jgi:hypothetical protein
MIRQAAQESGFDVDFVDQPRTLQIALRAREREGPLLLFDASEAANMGWFSRCSFYVDGRSGAVLQTPFVIANVNDPSGRPNPRALTVQIVKELPAHFRLPGRQPLQEKTIYSVLFNFLVALQKVGVGVCGIGSIRPLAGRIDVAGR